MDTVMYASLSREVMYNMKEPFRDTHSQKKYLSQNDFSLQKYFTMSHIHLFWVTCWASFRNLNQIGFPRIFN